MTCRSKRERVHITNITPCCDSCNLFIDSTGHMCNATLKTKKKTDVAAEKMYFNFMRHNNGIS